MSDENMTNNEETAALFVSAQRKKKAEEEAKKKAAEEQAKRDAAEAEVRRMEQEVEERKRKAEEERIALEKAEQEQAQKKAEMEKALKESANAIKEAPKAIKEAATEKKADIFTKFKKPILIGAGAIVAIIVIVMIISLGGSKGVTFDGMTFGGEYISSNAAYDISINYPDAEYSGIAEEQRDNGTLIHLNANNKCPIDADVFVTEPNEKIKSLSIESLYTYRMDEVLEDLSVSAKAAFESIYGSAQVENEISTKFSDELPLDISYFFDYVSDETGKAGSCFAILVPNSKGEIKMALYTFAEDAETYDDVNKMASLFLDNNFEDCVKVPGSNPPSAGGASVDYTIDDIHLGFSLPDTFVSKETGVDHTALYVDNNGAQLMIVYYECATDLETINADPDAYLELFHNNADEAGYSEMLEDRKNISRSAVDGFFCASEDQYTGVRGGVNCWEVDNAMVWIDGQTNVSYNLFYYAYAPEANKDVYAEIFGNAFKKAKDI